MSSIISDLKKEELRELYNSINQKDVRASMISELKKGACKYSFHSIIFTVITPQDIVDLSNLLQEEIRQVR